MTAGHAMTSHPSPQDFVVLHDRERFEHWLTSGSDGEPIRSIQNGSIWGVLYSYGGFNSSRWWFLKMVVSIVQDGGF